RRADAVHHLGDGTRIGIEQRAVVEARGWLRLRRARACAGFVVECERWPIVQHGWRLGRGWTCARFPHMGSGSSPGKSAGRAACRITLARPGCEVLARGPIWARLHAGVELDADEDGPPCRSDLRAGTAAGGLWRERPAAGEGGAAAAQRDGVEAGRAHGRRS